jgi:hypothetical protein
VVGLDTKDFETVQKNAVGLVVASFVVVGSQMAVYSHFSDTRGPAAGGEVQQVGKWGVIPHLPPS